uniref:Uncharacterized protein n=1 Tax=Echeneis naucrates TaxID=173247 RepID=A0A665U150_ECHNA
MSGRVALSSPRPENSVTLSRFRPQQSKKYNKPTHIAQKEEPWSRLHVTATVASTCRSIMYNENQTPNDSLDFHLRSVHDQSKDFLRSKNQILYQKETVSDDHRCKINQELLERQHEKDIRVWVDPQRRSIYNIK